MFDLKEGRRGRAECKSMKNGPPGKRLHVFDVDVKSQTATGQGHFLGEAPDLGHSGREHRIWNRTNLGSSPDLATSRVSGHKQFSAFLPSRYLSLYKTRLILTTSSGLFRDEMG